MYLYTYIITSFVSKTSWLRSSDCSSAAWKFPFWFHKVEDPEGLLISLLETFKSQTSFLRSFPSVQCPKNVSISHNHNHTTSKWFFIIMRKLIYIILKYLCKYIYTYRRNWQCKKLQNYLHLLYLLDHQPSLLIRLPNLDVIRRIPKIL